MADSVRDINSEKTKEYLIINPIQLYSTLHNYCTAVYGSTSQATHEKRTNNYNQKDAIYYPITYLWDVELKSRVSWIEKDKYNGFDRQLKKEASKILNESKELISVPMINNKVKDYKIKTLIAIRTKFLNVIDKYCIYGKVEHFSLDELLFNYENSINIKIINTWVFQGHVRFNGKNNNTYSGRLVWPTNPLSYEEIEFMVYSEDEECYKNLRNHFYFNKEMITYFYLILGRKELEFIATPSFSELNYYYKKFGKEFKFGRCSGLDLSKFDLCLYSKEEIIKNFNSNNIKEIF